MVIKILSKDHSARYTDSIRLLLLKNIIPGFLSPTLHCLLDCVTGIWLFLPSKKKTPSLTPSYSTCYCPFLSSSLQGDFYTELPTQSPFLCYFLNLAPTLKWLLLTVTDDLKTANSSGGFFVLSLLELPVAGDTPIPLCFSGHMFFTWFQNMALHISLLPSLPAHFCSFAISSAPASSSTVQFLYGPGCCAGSSCYFACCFESLTGSSSVRATIAD